MYTKHDYDDYGAFEPSVMHSHITVMYSDVAKTQTGCTPNTVTSVCVL